MSHTQLQLILDQFATQGTFSDEVIAQFCDSTALQIATVKHFWEHKDRAFAVALLNSFIAHRKAEILDVTMHELMLGAHLVGMHQQPEDILLNWKAKTVDFDSYCAVDIQVVPFIGVEATIEYLSNLQTKEAKEALEYISECNEAGDFDDMDEFFSFDKLPYWLKE
jgi:hypothetical protein